MKGFMVSCIAIALCLALFSCYSGSEPEILTTELTGNKATDKITRLAPYREESTGLMVYTASGGKYFKRNKDGVYFGSKIALVSTDSISNYTEVDIPIFPEISIYNNSMPYTISGDGKTLSLNPYGRYPPNSEMTVETYFDCFALQNDGPRGEFPIGRWLSMTEPLAHEELIITSLTLYRYTDYNVLWLIEYPYRLENERLYVGNIRWIPR
ncbi:MAG: hypothetical protein LBT43_06680 [Prevotella sp.]|jgi:hypothetical protein|nr:hypothetical protein [Prevotella sp.]